MLLISWQLIITVYVIFLTSCFGQKMFRVCERDDFYERMQQFDNKYLEREQSRLLINERNPSIERNNNIFENEEIYDNRRIFEKVLNDDGTNSRSASDVTRHLNSRVGNRHDYSQQSTSDRYQTLRQRLINDDDTHMDNSRNQNHLENRREENDKVLRQFEERRRERISSRHLDNSREEHRENSRLDDESYFTRRQFPRDRQNTLQRADNQKTIEHLNMIRNDRQTSKHTQRRNSNELDESVSERRVLRTIQQDNSDNRKRQAAMTQQSSRLTERASERFLQKEREFEQRREENKRERNIKKYSDIASRESAEKTYDSDRRYDTSEMYRRSENERKSDRLEMPASTSRFDNRNSQRVVYHRQVYLLSEKEPEIQKQVNNRHSENMLQNELDNEFDSRRRSGSSREYSREARRQKLTTNTDRILSEAHNRQAIIKLWRDENDRNRKERREIIRSRNQQFERDSRKTEDNRIYRQSGANLLDNSEFQLRDNRFSSAFTDSNEERIGRISQSLERYDNRVNRADSKIMSKDERKEHLEILKEPVSLEDNERLQHEKQHWDIYVNREIQRSETGRISERNANMRSSYDSRDRVNLLSSNTYQRVMQSDENNKPEVNRLNNPYFEENQKVLLSNGFVALAQAVVFSYVIMKTLKWNNDSKNHLPFKLGEALNTIGF